MYEMKLFIAGEEPKSKSARENLDGVCREYLKDRCAIEVIDVLKDFRPALEYNVFITPALVLLSPLPRATMFGSLADRQKLLTMLRLE